MVRISLRVCLASLSLIVLTACQLSPPSQQPVESVEDVSIADTRDDIYRQLRSDQAVDRVEALGALVKQPEQARKAISLVLTLLADDRQVDIARYVGSGFYSGTVSSPAAMAAELLAKLGHWSVLPLRLRLHDANPVIRRYATRAIGLMANPEHAGWLLSALADSSAAVSKEAYTALSKQDPQVYVKLIDQLEMDRYSLRQQLLVIQLLGNSRHGDALPALLRFSRHSDANLRSASFVALEKFSEAKLEDVVLQGLKDNSMRVRQNALILAPHHKSKAVLAAVIAQLSVDASAVRQVALEVLPYMTGEPARDADAWQHWWQTRSSVRQD